MSLGSELALSILIAFVLAVFATIYTRAFIVWNSLFALRTPEAVCFTAHQDFDGKRLECAATYSIEGQDPDARWWSLTAYKKNHLIPNSLGRYSFSQTTVSRSPGGHWRIRLSPQYQLENWLPTGEPEGNFGLTLRLYGPGRDTLANLEAISLPHIWREASA